MRKLIAIGMLLCILTVFVSAASAVVTRPIPTPSPTYTNSFIQAQTDLAGRNNFVDQISSGYGQSNTVAGLPTNSGVDVYSRQDAVVTDTQGFSTQAALVNAQGLSPYAESTQVVSSHVGNSCALSGTCNNTV